MLDIIVPLKFMSLHKAPHRAGPIQVPALQGRWGAGSVTPMLSQKKPRHREAVPTCPPRCHAALRWPLGGRETIKPLVNDDHTPFNRVWNWFCCLVFCSNYSGLAKLAHLHGLWVLCTSIYMTAKQSINFNVVLGMTFLLKVRQNFSPSVHSMVLPQDPKIP